MSHRILWFELGPQRIEDRIAVGGAEAGGESRQQIVRMAPRGGRVRAEGAGHGPAPGRRRQGEKSPGRRGGEMTTPEGHALRSYTGHVVYRL